MTLKIRQHGQEFSRSNVQSRVSVVGGLSVGTFVLLVLLPEIINSTAILQEHSYKKFAFPKQAGQFLTKTPNVDKQAKKFLITPVKKLKKYHCN